MPGPGPTLPAGSESTLAVGVLGRAHGLRGEIAFRPYDPDSDSIAHVDRLLLVAGGRREERRIVSVRPVADGYLVAFEGVESREAAAALTLAVAHVDRSLLPALSPEAFYVEDLHHSTVVSEQGLALGSVAGTFWNGAHDVMTVSGPQGEIMIPVVPAHVVSFDKATHTVTVRWSDTDDGRAERDPGDPSGID